jgi:uncharacterized protein (TIGR02266 family)
MGSKQRRHPRLAVAVEVTVKSASDTETGELVFHTLDLSAGGAFLRSDLLLEVGELLEVSFCVPGSDERISARARVAWATRQSGTKGEAGMALEFIDMSEAERARLLAALTDPNKANTSR